MGISKKIQDTLFDAEHKAVDLQGRLERWKEDLLAKARAMEIEEQVRATEEREQDPREKFSPEYQGNFTETQPENNEQ